MFALLPLDDRPPNFLFPVQLAAIGQDSLLQPPRELLGRFTVPGDTTALQQWLRDVPGDCRGLIVSIDMLAYGGLVGSRRPEATASQALQRLQVLRDWRRERPGVPLFAFNVLMRLAITMDSDDAVASYFNVMRWARLKDEAVRFRSDYLSEQLAQVELEIPAEVLATYRAARARNHGINLAMIDWLSEGIFDFLLMPQEDCTEFGLHRLEQQEVLERVREKGVTAKFALHPGADESALSLLAKLWGPGMRLRLHVSNEADMAQIAAYEDIPYTRSLESHVAAVGAKWTSDRPDVEFFVNAPVGSAPKDESEAAQAERKGHLVRMVEQIEAAVDNGLAVAVCDVAFPNGADDLLLRALEKRNLLGRISAFAAWNTAGNTTGTVLCQCRALLHALQKSGGGIETVAEGETVGEGESGDRFGRGVCEESQKLNRQFVFERLLDDWCYQSHVRSRIESRARDKGLSPLRMEAGAQGAGGMETLTRLELQGFAHILAARQFGSKLDRLQVALPWGRTFEVELAARLAEPVDL